MRSELTFVAVCFLIWTYSFQKSHISKTFILSASKLACVLLKAQRTASFISRDLDMWYVQCEWTLNEEVTSALQLQ